MSKDTKTAQFAVVALAEGVLDTDEDVLMYLPSDGINAQEMIDDLRTGIGYGEDYIVVRREVGPWTVLDSTPQVG